MIANECFSNGLKTLKTTISTPRDGGVAASSATTRNILNGALCYTEEESAMVSNTGEAVTEVFKDASGNMVATLKITVVVSDGGARETQLISCDDQTYETFAFCVPAGLIDAGTAQGTGGASGLNICDLGTCM